MILPPKLFIASTRARGLVSARLDGWASAIASGESRPRTRARARALLSPLFPFSLSPHHRERALLFLIEQGTSVIRTERKVSRLSFQSKVNNPPINPVRRSGGHLDRLNIGRDNIHIDCACVMRLTYASIPLSGPDLVAGNQ